MSNPKITPKNLSYDSSLPPFLQRLHNSSASASLDGRHERAIARPRRARDADADNEDEPVFVDEETGEVITAEDFKALNAGGERKPLESAGDEEVVQGVKTQEKDEEREKDKHSASIGASRKRKVAKVIGGGDSEEEDKTAVLKQSMKEKKAKSKGKKVKLSFGDDG